MRTATTTLIKIAGILLGLSLAPASVKAELGNESTPNSPLTIKAESPQSVPQFETGKVDPGQAAKPAQKTRAESTAMAAAMEAQAAAMSQMSCFQMMQEAMKKDDKDMMMMAQMMCQQAAQNLIAAAQNKRNNDKIKDPEPGKAATMELGKFKMPEASKEEALPTSQRAIASSNAQNTTSEDIPVADTVAIPSFKREVAKAPQQEVPATGAKAIEISNIPGTIEVAKLGYDETGKSGIHPAPERPLPPGTSVATAKPNDTTIRPNEEGKNSPEAITKGRRARKTDEIGEGQSSSGGSSDDNKTESESPLTAMLAMLNGNGQGELPAVSPGEDLVTLKEGSLDNNATPNIFEYATYRYRKATFEDGKIKSKTTKAANLSNASFLASQAGTGH